MRSVIALLLTTLVLTGGCDRRAAPDGQADATANAAAPATGGDMAGKPDRSHRGEPAPDFGFQGPGGKPTTLAAFSGRPVLVNLWATWCAPCVKEMPTLDALAAREGERLAVVAISQDLEGLATAQPFLQKHGWTRLATYADPDLRFSTGLGASLPTTILYGADGKERWRVTGAFEWDGEAASQLLAEGA